MNVSSPHYLLFPGLDRDVDTGKWRFLLRSADGSFRLEAEDIEPGAGPERLELLAVVRGLEAIDEPARVTLLTASSYVREGVRRGVLEWRTAGWRWERFGQMVPVKNLDLWQRIDRAMRFHHIECRSIRIDPPQLPAPEGSQGTCGAKAATGTTRRRRSLQYRRRGLSDALRHWVVAGLRGMGSITAGGRRANHGGAG